MREALDSPISSRLHGLSVLACVVNAITSGPNSREEIGDGAEALLRRFLRSAV